MADDPADAHDNATSPARRWLMLVALLVVSAVLLGLGTWQVQRLFWKQDLIARVDARVTAAPVPPPPPDRWNEISAAEDEYKHVIATGTLLHDKEVLVAASTERGPGYWVLTPLAQQNGAIVIVNRGFVTADQRAPALRSAGQAAGPTTISGLLRISEADSWILRKNDPAANRWYRRDPSAIAKARGLANVAPFFVDADATPNPGGWPVGGMTRISFANNHLIYALTWFALAAMAIAGLVAILRSEFGLARPRAPDSH